MGIRFRKSINLGGGVRVNVSKSGVGASVGTKGARVTKKAGGGTRTTASIPGTGISYVKDSSKPKSGNKAAAANETEPLHGSNFENKMFHILFRVLGIPLIALGALLALVEPGIGLASVAFGVGLELLANYYKKKGNR